MKKIIITAVAICISAIAFGQDPITKNVGDFETVKVYDRIVVNLVKSDENKIVITGEDAGQVQTVNKDGKLKIRMDFGLVFDGNNTFVNVYYTHLKVIDGNKTFVHVYYNNLEIIDGNEGAEITSNELIEQDEIEIKMQEGARIEIGLKVRNANMRAVTGGIIEVTGQATTQDVTVNTGGLYEGRDFETEDTKVFLQAGGEVEVYASKKADITIRAGGDVDVYGKPAEVKRKRTFGGRIRVL